MKSNINSEINNNKICTLNVEETEGIATLQLVNNNVNTNIETVCNLPSAEEYEELDRQHRENYFEWSTKKFSAPLYKCPKCNDGAMCRDETIVLTSIPPQHRYECNKCGHVSYHTI